MAVREEIVASAVTFLQDPSVAASPVENRIAFLQSKNLTQEEVDLALARASGGSSSPTNYSTYAPQQQVARQTQPSYGEYQKYQWQHPPDVPKRDWRDWFIMATVMGGVGYGLYFAAKRYVVPLISPPIPPQLEQDKASIDASFEKAFVLLDQLTTDTEALKSSEQARTERLDTALSEVESVIGELKTASRRREEDSRRINDEIRGIKDLIPKAMEGQKESTDSRLVELSNELKSLKKLMGQRMNSTPASATIPSAFGRPSGSNQTSGATANGTSTNNTSSTDSATPKPASVGNGVATEAAASLPSRSASPFTSIPSGRASIPAWQMAAANKSTSSTPAPTTPEATASSQETSNAPAA